jgi:predicted RNA-binding Zn-ribbon protein involved in translation (DUF1610 family)
MPKDTVAWECPICAHRHLWRWVWGEASIAGEGRGIEMHCDKCGERTLTTLVRIGRHAWAAVFPGRSI